MMRSTFALICICGIQLAFSTPTDALIGVLPLVRDEPSLQIERKTEHMIGVRNMDDTKESGSSGEFVGILTELKTKSRMSIGGLQTTRKVRKVTKSHGFCDGYAEYYRTYCLGMLADRDEATRNFLFQFCPSYENRCLHKR